MSYKILQAVQNNGPNFFLVFKGKKVFGAESVAQCETREKAEEYVKAQEQIEADWKAKVRAGKLNKAPKMDALRAVQIIEEGDGTEEERHDAWQFLIDSGVVWHLQGSYGRQAAHLIEIGECTMPEGRR